MVIGHVPEYLNLWMHRYDVTSEHYLINPLMRKMGYFINIMNLTENWINLQPEGA